MLRIFVIDDYPVERLGLTALFEAQADVRVSTAPNGQKCAEQISVLSPDLLLIELNPDGNVNTLLELHGQFPRLPTLVYSAEAAISQIELAIRAGVQGAVLKSSSPETLLLAIRQLSLGNFFIDPALGASLLLGRRPALRRTAAALKARERAVLELLAQGRRNKDIAAALYLSERTVKFYASSLFKKLQVNNRTEAVNAALRLGLIEHDL